MTLASEHTFLNASGIIFETPLKHNPSVVRKEQYIDVTLLVKGKEVTRRISMSKFLKYSEVAPL
jgi:hypothetical protein